MKEKRRSSHAEGADDYEDYILQRKSNFRGSMQIQSEHDLRESHLLKDFHSKSIPLQI
jgi:hypothetical protein